MHIYYIRHGQSTNNQLYAESGSEKKRVEDPQLTELGLRQARLLAEHVSQESHITAELAQNRKHLKIAGEGDLGNYQFTHIYSSLMTRALQTASILARRIHLPMTGLVDLYEVGGLYLEDEQTGELIGKPGKTPAELRRDFPDLVLPGGLPEDGW